MGDIDVSRAERLDQYVARQFPAISRASAAKLVDQGRVQVNGKVEARAGYKLRAHDAVAIDYDPEAEEEPTNTVEIPVIYEDRDCVVINKPTGVLSHSKGAFNPEMTVASWLRERLRVPFPTDNERAGIVHRLDRATSGVMIGAKTPEANSRLQKQFAQRKTKKTYLAVVKGQLAQPEAVIDMPIERNPRKPQTFRVGVGGKSAQTTYKVLASGEHYSLVELRPATGRTHQLRVHLKHLGHPIVGDVLYGGPSANRLYLHAESLELTLPNRHRKVFTAPLPANFKEVMNT